MKLKIYAMVIILCLMGNMLVFAENTEADSFAPNTDVGDYTYFDSNYPVISQKKYYNVEAYPKSDDNSITFGRLDYKNPDRDNGITIEKNSTTGDAYIDVKMKKSPLYKSNKTYNYFVISADVEIKQAGVEVYLFRIRDNSVYSSEGYTSDRTLSTITPGGKLIAFDSTEMPAEKLGKKFNYKCYINLTDSSANIYINGEPFVSNMKFYHKIKALDLVRLSANSGTGSIYINNWEVTGLEKPFNSDGTDVKSSVFPDDTVTEEYLKDKTVFHHYADKLVKNGVKYDLSAPTVYENNEIYAAIDDFNFAFNTDFDNSSFAACQGIYNNGEYLVPVKKAAKTLLGKYVSDDNNGAVYIADKALMSDIENDIPVYRRPYITPISEVSKAEILNDYILYDRPSAETLSEKFLAMSGVHPRLFGGEKTFSDMLEKAKNDSALSAMINSVIAKADYVLSTEPTGYVFEDAYRMYNHASSFEDNMINLGFAYRITKDTKYSTRAMEELNIITDFPDLNTTHVIDAGMFLNGLGIAYDWMYDAFSYDERNKIVSAAVNLGLKPLDNVFYGRLQGCAAGANDSSTQITGIFPKWTSNYNMVANEGMTIAAISMADEEPDICFDVIENTVRSVEYTMKGFNPDGGWVESTDYFSFTMKHLNYMINALENVFGTSFGLMNSPGIDKAAEFIISMQSQISVNSFHDTSANKPSNAWLLWLGHRFGDDAVINFRKEQIKSKSFTTSAMETIEYSRHINERNTDKQFPKMLVTKGTESFSMRNSYTDSNAFYLSAHGGPVTAYHSHNDAGAFVFDMLGQNWAIDLGKEDYNINASDTQIYRKRTEGHNTLTINNDLGFNQLAGTFATISGSASTDSEGYIIYDMSDLYADADSVKRGFFSDKNFSEFTVRDEIKLNKQSEVYWFMHTKADISVKGNDVTLTQNGKSIKMNVLSDADSTQIYAMDAVPLDTSPNPEEQNPNTGIHKLAIKMNSGNSINLTVKFSQTGLPAENIPLSDWNVSETEDVTNVFDTSFDGFNINTNDFEIEGATKKITKSNCNLYSKNGLFGKDKTKNSFCAEYKGTGSSASLNMEFDIDNVKSVGSGDKERLSFYYAFDNNFIPFTISADTVKNEITSSVPNFAYITKNSISVCGLDNGNEFLHYIPNKWYHCDIVIDSDGYVDVCIDNVKVLSGKSESVFSNGFGGISKLQYNINFLKSVIKEEYVYLDNISLVHYTNNAEPDLSVGVEVTHNNYNLSKYINSSVAQAESYITCGYLCDSVYFENTDNFVVRNSIGEEASADESLSGKYIDLTLKNGYHRYIYVLPMEKYYIQKMNSDIQLSTDFHKNGVWSCIARSNSHITYLSGLDGKKADDRSIAIKGPYGQNSPNDGYYHDYLDFSVMKENSISSCNDIAFSPIVFDSKILVTGGVSSIIYLKKNNESSYGELLRFENGNVYSFSNIKPIGTYAPDKWIDLSISLYPGKRSVDVTINGETSVFNIASFSDDFNFANIFRIGTKSYDANEQGYVALDDVSVYSGIALDRYYANEIICSQNENKIANSFENGEINISATLNYYIPELKMLAVLYKNGIPSEFALGEYNGDTIECILKNSINDADEVRIFMWNDKMLPMRNIRTIYHS